MLDIAALDALDLRVIVDNETDGLSSVDEGLPQISEIADRASRLPAHVYDGHECKMAGGEIALEADAHRLCDGFFYGSGAIDRVTEFETGLVGHHTLRGGRAIPDPLIMDERFVAAQVKGRGVSVLSACSHAGIVNACLAGKVAFDDAPIDVALGGYHLAGKAMESRIEPTVRELDARISPKVVAPGHCTGWRAKAELSRAFAPGRYAPSVVGSWYRLAAD